MKTERKLFNSGEKILTSKNYGFGLAILSCLFLSVLIVGGIVEIGMPKKWFFTLPLIIIIGLFFMWIFLEYLQEKIFPDSAFGKRYDDIVLFDGFLVGRIETRGGTIEDKIEFQNIQYITKESDRVIKITFNDEFESESYQMNLALKNNKTQDYLISNLLSRKQKKEIVNYLNDLINLKIQN
jgi:hypothetical protein